MWHHCRRIVSVVLIILVILCVLIVGAQCRSVFSGGADDGDVEGGRKMIGLAVREPYFKAAIDGKLSTIGRVNRGVFKELRDGEVVTVHRSRPKGDTTEYPGPKRFKANITSRHEYPSADAMLEKEGVAKMFPGIKSVDKAVEVFRGDFHTKKDEDENGVVAFGIKASETGAPRRHPKAAEAEPEL